MWSTHICGLAILYVPICIFCLVLTVDKNTAKFKEWLDVGSLVELKPNSDVIEVLGFFAYETVREVGQSLPVVRPQVPQGVVRTLSWGVRKSS